MPKAPTFATLRKPILFVFGLVLTAWEIMYGGRDPYVFIFLAMCLGFIPAKTIDDVLRSRGGLFAPSKDLIEEDEPVKEAAS